MIPALTQKAWLCWNCSAVYHSEKLNSNSFLTHSKSIPFGLLMQSPYKLHSIPYFYHYHMLPSCDTWEMLVMKGITTWHRKLNLNWEIHRFRVIICHQLLILALMVHVKPHSFREGKVFHERILTERFWSFWLRTSTGSAMGHRIGLHWFEIAVGGALVFLSALDSRLGEDGTQIFVSLFLSLEQQQKIITFNFSIN